MGKLKRMVFTEEQIRMLEINPNVLRVTESAITYTPAFKLAALQAYIQGQTPSEVFIRAGFDLDVIGHQKPKHSLKRWRDTFNQSRKDSRRSDEVRVAQVENQQGSCRQKMN